MLLYVQEDVEVARRRAARACFALAGQADTRAGIDAGRYLDIELLGKIDPPFPAATAAGIGDDFAATVAIGAGALDHEEALFRAHLADARAQIAGPRPRTRPRTGAVAILARLRDFDLDLRILAVEGVFQADLHVVAKVRAAPRLRAPGAAEGLAEDGFEDIADIAEIRTRMAAAAPALREGGMAVAIVGRAFLRILETVVGDADRLELRLALVAARIAVRVMLHRKLAIGGLDRPAIRVARDAEYFVEVDFGG